MNIDLRSERNESGELFTSAFTSGKWTVHSHGGFEYTVSYGGQPTDILFDVAGGVFNLIISDEDHDLSVKALQRTLIKLAYAADKEFKRLSK